MKINIFPDYKQEGWLSMEVYAESLIRALKGLKIRDLKVKTFLALPKFSSFFPKEKKKARYFFRYVINPFFAFFNQGDVNHIIDQAYTPLLLSLNHRKTIVTCHDLIIPFWQERQSDLKRTWKSKLRLKIGKWRFAQLRKAAKIIAVSQATKDKLVREIKIDPQKIVVIHEGVEEKFRKIKDQKKLLDFKNQYQLPDNFLLHVGSCADYKNIDGLLKIFYNLAKKKKNLFLIKVGENWQPKHLRLIKRLKIENKIRHLGYLPEKELPLIYNLATVLVQPSFVEGFGLTVLEAMICSCPVFISQAPALKEVTGQAGIIFNEKDEEGASLTILKTLNNQKLLSNFVLKGEKRARQFTWVRTAQKTYQVYQEVKKLK